jgi:hypothetical protein
MPRRIAILVMLGLAAASPAAAQSPLERARQLYNAGELDASIEAAGAARLRPATAAAAALIIARARLEKFRLTATPEDLEAARTDLRTLNPQSLTRQELIEWQIGLGQALYFENELGPASEWFRALIPSVRASLPPADADRLLEWWAGTVSRLAESLSGEARTEKYRELLAVMERELERDPLARTATYWIPVACRGVGDLNRAWNAAIAGWIRARGLARPEELRSDLEQFVIRTLIPERAQSRTGQRVETKATATEIVSMTEEWKKLTGRWNGEN